MARSTERYKLFAITYGSGGHFISAMRMSPAIIEQTEWFRYDGQWKKESKERAYSLNQVIQRHLIPTDFVIYLRDCQLTCEESKSYYYTIDVRCL